MRPRARQRDVRLSLKADETRLLETDPNAPRVILTERGVGYVFALPVEPLGWWRVERNGKGLLARADEVIE